MNQLTPVERTKAEELAKYLEVTVEDVATAMKQKTRIAQLMAECHCDEPEAIFSIILNSNLRRL